MNFSVSKRDARGMIAVLILSALALAACDATPTLSSGELDAKAAADAARVTEKLPKVALRDVVLVKGGAFSLGSDSGDADEQPVVQVTVSDFYMGRAEVNVADFLEAINFAYGRGYVKQDGNAIVMGTGALEPLIYIDAAYEDAKDAMYFDGGLFFTREGKDRHPVIFVTWYGAAAYCNFRSLLDGRDPCYDQTTWDCDFTKDGYRLPTEAEWEYAAKAGKDLKFVWGDGEPTGNIADDSFTKRFPNIVAYKGYDDGYVYTAPVGTFKANGLGIVDLDGNASEWLNDWYGPYDPSATTDPRGPATGDRKVIRGPSWFHHPGILSTTFRKAEAVTFDNAFTGFRVASSDTAAK